MRKLKVYLYLIIFGAAFQRLSMDDYNALRDFLTQDMRKTQIRYLNDSIRKLNKAAASETQFDNHGKIRKGKVSPIAKALVSELEGFNKDLKTFNSKSHMSNKEIDNYADLTIRIHEILDKCSKSFESWSNVCTDYRRYYEMEDWPSKIGREEVAGKNGNHSKKSIENQSEELKRLEAKKSENNTEVPKKMEIKDDFEDNNADKKIKLFVSVSDLEKKNEAKETKGQSKSEVKLFVKVNLEGLEAASPKELAKEILEDLLPSDEQIQEALDNAKKVEPLIEEADPEYFPLVKEDTKDDSDILDQSWLDLKGEHPAILEEKDIKFGEPFDYDWGNLYDLPEEDKKPLEKQEPILNLPNPDEKEEALIAETLADQNEDIIPNQDKVVPEDNEELLEENISKSDEESNSLINEILPENPPKRRIRRITIVEELLCAECTADFYLGRFLEFKRGF